jgi:hypothetical protein
MRVSHWLHIEFVWKEIQDNDNKSTRVLSRNRLCNRRKMKISHWLYIESVWKKTQDNYSKNIRFFSKDRLYNWRKIFDFERKS